MYCDESQRPPREPSAPRGRGTSLKLQAGRRHATIASGNAPSANATTGSPTNSGFSVPSSRSVTPRRANILHRILTVALVATVFSVPTAAAANPTNDQSPENSTSVPRTERAVFPSGLSVAAAVNLTKEASPRNPVVLDFRTGDWSGIVRLTGSSADSATFAAYIRSSKAADGNAPITAIEASPTTIARVAQQYPMDVQESTSQRSYGATTESVSYDPATSGCRTVPSYASGMPQKPRGWTANVPSSGRTSQVRMQGLSEATTHTFTGIGNENGQWPCTRRQIDMTQGQGFKVTSMFAYEHDYKVDQCGQGKYVATSGEAMDTNMPFAYLDTRASDSDCRVDFTVGTIAPYLLKKANTYTIHTWGDAETGTQVTASRATASLVGEVLEIDGTGCQLDEYPVGVLNGNPTPWCVDVVPPFGAVFAPNFIRIPDFIIKYNGTCYDWRYGRGYTWCHHTADPN